MTEFRVLGPVEIWASGAPQPIGQPRQRLVLAALVVDAGALVTTETLIDRVWGDKPPAKVREALYSNIARIRQFLGDAAAGEPPVPIVRRTGGYVLQADPDLVDLHRFRRLVKRAGGADSDDHRRVSLLREALGLWRGEPLAGLSGAWVERTRTSWVQRYLQAIVMWGDAEVQTGSPDAVIGPLTDVIAEHPLVESTVEVLMSALQATGRSSDALAQYAGIQERLAEALGADPGAGLQAAHRTILRGEPQRRPTGRARHIVRTVPALLPLDVFGFAGRDDEVARLDALLAAGAEQPTAMVIGVLSGSAGVGKTALAVHWAHRVRGRFPDGQLYLNLRGFGPGDAMPPAEAVRRLLDALGLPAQRIPPGADAQVDLYRSELVDRRMLILLDNARDAEQIRPLLPGTPTAAVVVTSRNSLAGLVAAQGARPLPIDRLAPAEARELLARRLGTDRVAAEPDAVEEIITRCVRLSLALAIVAARAAMQPGLSLAAVAAELRDSDGLDALAGVDETTDLRSVFLWSYRILTPAAARLFRLLGLDPGLDPAAAAVASLAGQSPGDVRPLLTELTEANLVTVTASGHYSFHDLLRACAVELVHATESCDERQAAIHRVFDHYLNTAHTAARLLDPHRDPIALDPHRPGVTLTTLATPAQALDWLTTEHASILASIRHGTAADFDAQVWKLTWTLTGFLQRRGYWLDWVASHQVALNAVRRLGDTHGQAFVHRHLSQAFSMLSRNSDALAHSEAALRLFEQIGDHVGQAYMLLDIGREQFERQYRYREALDHTYRACELFRLAGHPVGEARALNAIGWYHGLLGEHDLALARCEEALALQLRLGDVQGAAGTWDSLGHLYLQTGRHRQAIDAYENAVTLNRQAGDRYYEAEALASLGGCHHAVDDIAAARRAWRAALDILDDIGHADAERVRTTLAQFAADRPA